MVPKVGLAYLNIGPEKAKKSSEQGAGYSFLVLQSLRWSGAQQHTETWQLVLPTGWSQLPVPCASTMC